MNELHDLLEFIKKRVGDKKQIEKPVESLTQTHDQEEKHGDVGDKKSIKTSIEVSTPKVGDKQTIEKSTNVLTPTTSKDQKYILGKHEERVGVKKPIEKQVESLTQTLTSIAGRVWIKSINVSRTHVKRGDKKYYYLRKRVELPRDFDDDVAVIMRRRDFEKLIRVIAEAMGVSINEEKLRELLYG